MCHNLFDLITYINNVGPFKQVNVFVTLILGKFYPEISFHFSAESVIF